jgi:hypothetical protein
VPPLAHFGRADPTPPHRLAALLTPAGPARTPPIYLLWLVLV